MNGHWSEWVALVTHSGPCLCPSAWRMQYSHWDKIRVCGCTPSPLFLWKGIMEIFESDRRWKPICVQYTGDFLCGYPESQHQNICPGLSRPVIASLSLEYSCLHAYQNRLADIFWAQKTDYCLPLTGNWASHSTKDVILCRPTCPLSVLRSSPAIPLFELQKHNCVQTTMVGKFCLGKNSVSKKHQRLPLGHRWSAFLLWVLAIAPSG